MKFDKLKTIKEINEMLEEIDYIKRKNVFISEKEDNEIRELYSLVSHVWLWFSNKYK